MIKAIAMRLGVGLACVAFGVACGGASGEVAVGEANLTASVEVCGTMDSVAGLANRPPQLGGDEDLAIKDKDDGAVYRLNLVADFAADETYIRHVRFVKGCVKGRLFQGFEGPVVEVSEIRVERTTSICGTIDQKWALRGDARPVLGGDTDLAIKDRSAPQTLGLGAAETPASVATLRTLQRERPVRGCVTYDGQVHQGFEGGVIEVLGFTRDP